MFRKFCSVVINADWLILALMSSQNSLPRPTMHHQIDISAIICFTNDAINEIVYMKKFVIISPAMCRLWIGVFVKSQIVFKRQGRPGSPEYSRACSIFWKEWFFILKLNCFQIYQLTHRKIICFKLTVKIQLRSWRSQLVKFKRKLREFFVYFKSHSSYFGDKLLLRMKGEGSSMNK